MRYIIYCRKSSEAEERQVLSLESQFANLAPLYQNDSSAEIAQSLDEAFSAKAPGRPVFNQMIELLNAGEADGIIAYSPDRLSRNSLDGGLIIYLLDIGVIKDLRFATYRFENTPEGKFMLAIMLGQSKYYSDNLTRVVRRGNRTKLEKGWRPNIAPLGYLNDKETRTIVKDPALFPLVRRIYDLMLTGVYSPREIARIARDDWGFRTPKRRKSGGKALAMSSVYKLLTNPFYAGIIIWGGETFAGKHEPLCSLEEQERIRGILEGRSRPRPQKYAFPYVGIIRCGSCGLGITAEHKTNRWGSRYIYYHCTKSRMPPRCREPYIEARQLEAQVLIFLERITVPERAASSLESALIKHAKAALPNSEAELAQLDRAIADATRQISELTDLRIRSLLSDEEFLERRQKLQIERENLVQQRAKLAERGRCIEPLQAFISFRKYAAIWYREADEAHKRLMLKTAASNLSLKQKILNIQARNPFITMGDSGRLSPLRADVEDVRTFFMKNDEETREVIDSLLKLRDEFCPELKPITPSGTKSPKSPSPPSRSYSLDDSAAS